MLWLILTQRSAAVTSGRFVKIVTFKSLIFGIAATVSLLLPVNLPVNAEEPDVQAATAAREPNPLSFALRTLEHDLTDQNYLDVLDTMIPTDLAAEWQRVGTPDNYLAFAEQNGGIEQTMSDEALRVAFERRRAIADQFLALMRGAYVKRKIMPPFDDEAVLLRVLTSADRRPSQQLPTDVSVRILMPAPGAERHWPCFRGPTSHGIVFDTAIASEWSPTRNIVWKTRLPGRGNSSPVVWGDHLFVTAESVPRATEAPLTAEDQPPDRLLLCYSVSSGKLQWQQAAPQPPQHEVLYWKNTLASSTPVTDGERVIAFLGNAGLLCCDFRGQRLWHVDLGTFPTMHGPGSTPVLYQNLVILIQDQNEGESFCGAFDKRTGAKVWQQPRKHSMGWSSPVLFRIGDHDELVFNGSNEIVAYDPATGRELWKATGSSIESIPMIVYGGGLLFSASGRNGPIFALRPGGTGDISDSHLVWRVERGGPHVPTPAYHDGKLFVVSDTGVVSCLDAFTGETLSQKRLRGRFCASPLVVDDRLLLTNEDGITYVVRGGTDLQLLGQHDLQETVYATPAVLGGRLYFRTAENLVCIGVTP